MPCRPDKHCASDNFIFAIILIVYCKLPFISVNANAAGGIALGLRELFILQMRNKHRSGLEIATYRKDIWSMPGLKIVMV